jgi:hypothetical protein
VRSNYAPFSVGQIGLVSRDEAAVLLSSGWLHMANPSCSRGPLESRQVPITQPFLKTAGDKSPCVAQLTRDEQSA